MACKKEYEDGMTKEEFKNWLKRFDADKDGQLSRAELVSAVRTFGGWFNGVRAWWSVRSADSDGNGYIDDHEIDNLVEFARNYFGVRVSIN